MRGGENKVEGGDMQGFFGARWWRLDFHTHTSASTDYGECPYQTALRESAPQERLLNFMKAGVARVLDTDYSPAIHLILFWKHDLTENVNWFGATRRVVTRHKEEIA